MAGRLASAASSAVKVLDRDLVVVFGVLPLDEDTPERSSLLSTSVVTEVVGLPSGSSEVTAGPSSEAGPASGSSVPEGTGNGATDVVLGSGTESIGGGTLVVFPL